MLYEVITDNAIAVHRQSRVISTSIDLGGTLTLGPTLLQTMDADDGPAAEPRVRLQPLRRCP